MSQNSDTESFSDPESINEETINEEEGALVAEIPTATAQRLQIIITRLLEILNYNREQMHHSMHEVDMYAEIVEDLVTSIQNATTRIQLLLLNPNDTDSDTTVSDNN